MGLTSWFCKLHLGNKYCARVGEEGGFGAMLGVWGQVVFVEPSHWYICLEVAIDAVWAVHSFFKSTLDVKAYFFVKFNPSKLKESTL